MKTLAVVQHTSAEYLGLLEDHLEGRRIRFRYARPFATGGRVPGPDGLHDGLVLLGGGPWGSAGTRDVPTQLVVYPGENHGLTVPSYLRDRLERLIGWFDRYLKP